MMLRRLVIGCLVAACLAFGTLRAQTPSLNIPIDQVRDQLTTSLTNMAAVASGPAAPFVQVLGDSLREFGQSILWIIALDVDAAVMQAWTMQSLLEIDRKIRDTVAYTGPMLAKVCEDRAALEKITKDAYLNRQTGQAVLDNEAKLEAITRVMEDLRAPKFAALPAMGADLLKQFDALRARVVAGGVVSRKPAGGVSAVSSYFTPDMLGQNWKLTDDLIKYVQLVQEVEALIAAPKKIGVTVDGRRQDRDVVAGSDSHLRLLVTNQSADLVYFVRVRPAAGAAPATYRIPTDPNGCAPETPVPAGAEFDATKVSYAVPAATASRWIAVYPEGSTTDLDKPKTPAEQAPAGAGSLGGDGKVDFMHVQLPSAVWLPVHPGDTLEVRVATYGPERQRVRWMTLHSPHGTVRPEVATGGGGGTSISRGFYYLGYEVAYDIVSRTVVRHYAAREDYAWKLEGMWKDGGVTFPETNVNELRDVAGGRNGRIPLLLRNDHLQWTLPADMAAFGTGQALTATVSGTAWFEFRTVAIGMPNPGDKTETSKGGDLNILIQVW